MVPDSAAVGTVWTETRGGATIGDRHWAGGEESNAKLRAEGPGKAQAPKAVATLAVFADQKDRG